MSKRIRAKHMTAAETTTATTEDIDRLAHSKDVRVYGDYGAGWRDGVKAAAGLLARPTPSRDDISDAIEHSGIAIGTTDAEQAAEAERRYPSGAVPEATLTYPTDALREHSRGAFVAGAEWAASRAETTTPTTEEVRRQYTREQPPHVGTVSSKSDEFDRWLAGIRAEVAEQIAARIEAECHPPDPYDPAHGAYKHAARIARQAT